MTREKWAAMTADERRIKVAELRGWRRQGDVDVEFVWLHPVLCPASDMFVCCNFPPARGLPDYLNNLNAMHNVEKTILDAFVRRRYYQHLDAITGDQWNTIVATAAQRAEAFVLTLEPEDK
jgi:hypothetical protein